MSWNPAQSLLDTIRTYQGSRNPAVRKLAVLQHRFWSVVTGADIPLNTRIGKGVQLPHPNGVVIHPDATIGDNCMLMQQSTIGVKSALDDSVPTLEHDVFIGAGARVLGGITIGAYSTIGANAVVLQDVPPGSMVVGIPAKVIGSSGRLP